MKNIWEIFRRDIKRIKNNVIAMIVIMGITAVSYTHLTLPTT